MKKTYETPKVEKMEFDYSDTVVASKCTGSIYREYDDSYTGCKETETDNWVNPTGNE